jgi:hypothetical protein
MKGGVAKPVWSRFNTFGIQMIGETRKELIQTTLAVDNGTKYEGYSVVCGMENNLSVNWNLPDKKKIVDKMVMRAQLRRSRRHRNCRRRPERFDNRCGRSFLAPSQAVIVGSRLKAIREFIGCYPISEAGYEDVRFDYRNKRWGANFTTVELGKFRIKDYFKSQGVEVFDFSGFETQELRKKYGYKKIKAKSADRFEAHCSDSLAIACEVGPGERVEPGRFIVVDDTYRSKRRQLHYTQPAKGGIRREYSKGTVFGFRKGLLLGRPDGHAGRLCGEDRGNFRYLDFKGVRQRTKNLAFACGHFITRPGLVSAFAERKRT